MDFIPYDQLRGLLKFEGDTIDDYPDMAVVRTNVTAAIESYLGRKLEYGTYTETRLPQVQPTKMIYLDAIPVESVSSVTVEGVALSSSSYVITDYGLRLATAVTEEKVVVVYTGGIDDGDEPAELIRAGVIQTAYEFQGKQNIGAETVNTEGGSVTRPALQLLPEVKRTLAKLRHPKELL